MINKIFLCDDISQLKQTYKKIKHDNSAIINESVSDARKKSIAVSKSIEKRILFLSRFQFFVMIPIFAFIIMYSLHLHFNGVLDTHVNSIFIATILFIITDTFVFICFEILKSKQRTVLNITRYLLSIL